MHAGADPDLTLIVVHQMSDFNPTEKVGHKLVLCTMLV